MQVRHFRKGATIVSEVGPGTWQLGGDWGAAVKDHIPGPY